MTKTVSLEALADNLGSVRAKISDLREKETQLKEQLIEAEVEAVEGKLFRVTVSRFNMERVDYRGLVDRLDPPRRIVNQFTTVEEQVRVSVKSR